MPSDVESEVEPQQTNGVHCVQYNQKYWNVIDTFKFRHVYCKDWILIFKVSHVHFMIFFLQVKCKEFGIDEKNMFEFWDVST